MARTEVELIRDRKIVSADFSAGAVDTAALATDAVSTVKLQDASVTSEKLAADISFFPVGGIIMWHGSTGSIPTGWALCDGTNGTPNLSGKFIVSQGSGYAVNDNGGSNTHAITEAELPAHSHTIADGGGHGHSGSGGSTGSAGGHGHSGGTSRQDRNHTHNGNTSASGNHYHGPSGSGGFDNEGNGNPLRALYEDGPPFAGVTWDLGGGNHAHNFQTAGISNDHAHSVTINAVGGHSHNFNLSISSGGSHTHTSSSVGSGSAVDMRPAYYALAFIMKTA